MLPQVDDVGGLVERDDDSLAGEPRLTLQQLLELLPGVLARPEHVWTNWHAALAGDDLVDGQADVLLCNMHEQGEAGNIGDALLCTSTVVLHTVILLSSCLSSGEIVQHSSAECQREWQNVAP